MGSLIELHPKHIVPSQAYLKADTLNYILEFFRTATTTLPPPPLVKRHANSYVAIDGHNLLAVCHALDIPCDVYLVEHAQDHLPGQSAMSKKRNDELQLKFDTVIPTTADFSTLIDAQDINWDI